MDDRGKGNQIKPRKRGAYELRNKEIGSTEGTRVRVYSKKKKRQQSIYKAKGAQLSKGDGQKI